MKKTRKQAAKVQAAPAETDLPVVEVVIEQESTDIAPVLTAEENQRLANKARHSERYSAPKK
jgi:hypothetical protein